MDDFNISTLHESRNEWCARLVTILTPLIIDGYKAILEDAVKICKQNNEYDKYLMTFQNFISRVPKWNSTIIEAERKRILEKSRCAYLEDLVTCVHIIQLKILTAMRVGQKQKKIDITVPKLDEFIHKAYINVARKVYKNTYLFELKIPPLQIQKHNRELEIIVQECLLNTLRESIPVEAILKAYMDETTEEDFIEEIKEKVIEEKKVVAAPTMTAPALAPALAPGPATTTPSTTAEETTATTSKLSFSDLDYVKDIDNNVASVSAPKSIERLEEISKERYNQRRLDNDEDDDDDNLKLNISDSPVSLDKLDIQVFDEPNTDLFPELKLDDVEILDDSAF
jgi:hypothetical protein